MATPILGRFTFVLHAHLPYVLNHGRWPHGMDWLNEATAETYIPILNALNALIGEGILPTLSIDLSPVLAEQLADSLFPTEFTSYLDQKIEAATEDLRYFRKTRDDGYAETAEFWLAFYSDTKRSFEDAYGGDLIGAFRRLQDKGALDIMTCGATHGYFPLLSQDGSIQAQVQTAVQTHARHFHRPPAGIWIPECAYRPGYAWIPPVDSVLGQQPIARKGVEDFLSQAHLKYFVIDSAMLKGGQAVGVYLERFQALKRLWDQFEKETRFQPERAEKSPYELYLLQPSHGGEPVAILTRDPKTGMQVWSAEWGYPGDGWYLDFHKKRFPGGHRYWRVTSVKTDLGQKQRYIRKQALERIPEHVRHYTELVRGILSEHRVHTGRPGCITAPYDAELFGHWWFEGTDFLKGVLRALALDPEIRLSNGSAMLQAEKPSTVVTLPEGSWGQGEHHYIWLNNETEWTWKHIYDDEFRMVALAESWQRSNKPEGQSGRAVRQAARELLLLQASDWQFLISTVSAKDYAELRFSEHHKGFTRLCSTADTLLEGGDPGAGEIQFLEDCEERDRLFPDVNPALFIRS